MTKPKPKLTEQKLREALIETGLLYEDTEGVLLVGIKPDEPVEGEVRHLAELLGIISEEPK